MCRVHYLSLMHVSFIEVSAARHRDSGRELDFSGIGPIRSRDSSRRSSGAPSPYSSSNRTSRFLDTEDRQHSSDDAGPSALTSLPVAASALPSASLPSPPSSPKRAREDDEDQGVTDVQHSPSKKLRLSQEPELDAQVSSSEPPVAPSGSSKRSAAQVGPSGPPDDQISPLVTSRPAAMTSSIPLRRSERVRGHQQHGKRSRSC